MRKWIRLISVIGVIATFVALGVIHGTGNGYNLFTDTRLASTLLLAGATAVASYALGIPDTIATRRGIAAATIVSALFGAVSVSLVALAVGAPVLPRSVLGYGVLALIPWQLLCFRATADAAATATTTRVIAVVNPLSADEIESGLANDSEQRAEWVAAVKPTAVEAIGLARPLEVLAEEMEATMIVVDQEAQLNESVVAQVANIHATGRRVRSLSMFMEEWVGKVPLSELERTSLFFDVSELHGSTYPRLKRVFDLVFCAVALPPLAVLGITVSIANMLFSGGARGPLLFRQERIGKGGEIFEILKFRTMHSSESSHWTTDDDARITPVGRVLRRTHLDELPQVINILRGDISLVGPRPEQVDYVEELSEKLPFYNVRHIIRPGLTGWAQLKLGYTNDLAGAAEKLQYELFYLRHQGLSLDARIIVKTLRHLFKEGGM